MHFSYGLGIRFSCSLSCKIYGHINTAINLYTYTNAYLFAQLAGARRIHQLHLCRGVRHPHCHVIAHGDEEVRLILSSRVESAPI